MKTLLAFAFIFTTSAGYAGQLNIDVVPSQGGASYLQFIEANGKITSNGNGPYTGPNNQTYVLENADGSLHGFMFGTPVNLSCSATACVGNSSTDVRINITKSGSTTKYDGTIRYRFVHATVTDTEITVTSDASFDVMKRKNDTFSGQGDFSGGRFGGFDVRLSAKEGFNINDPRLFVLTVLNIFTAR